MLDTVDIVYDPVGQEPVGSSSSQRVCRTCYDEVFANVPSRLSNRNGSAIERIVVDQERLTVPGGLTRRQSSSQLSDLAECAFPFPFLLDIHVNQVLSLFSCPVCNQNLDEVGDAVEQEEHVRQCLEGGPGQDLPTSRYLVYRLPAESALLGVECESL